MKAKTYYANSLALTSRRPTPNHLNTREGYGDVPVKVIKSSDVEKLVEKAGEALRKCGIPNATPGGWYERGVSDTNARAVFKAIGLLP